MKTKTSQLRQTSKFNKSVEAVKHWSLNFTTLNMWVFLLLIVLVQLLRSGFLWSYNIETYLGSVSAFPNLDVYWKTSLSMFWFADVLNIETIREWKLYYLGLTLNAFVILSILLTRMKTGLGNKNVLITLIMLSPTTTVLLTEVGRYDVFILSGAILVGLTKSKLFFGFGCCLMLFANYEQGVAALLCLSLMVMINEEKKQTYLKFGTVILSISVVTFVISRVYPTFSVAGGGTRTQWLTEKAGVAILGNFNSLPLLILSTYGIAWIFIMLVIKQETSVIKRIIIVLALIVLPMCAMLFTYDGTRVFVCVSSAAFLYQARRWFLDHPNINLYKISLHRLLLFSFFVPALNVEVLGKVRQPYFEIVSFFSN